jgi:hypothetical protein
MPNWVYNYVVITGKTEELQAFLTKATEPRPYENGLSEDRDFSFWNFVAPPEDKLGEYFGIHGWADGKQQGDTPTNWYNWNNENWGTKWDANDQYATELDELGDGTARVSISYNTAWSIPEPVMRAMVGQHPELHFKFSCEEEQGWGADFAGEDGELEETKSWDIPNSHADYVDRDNEDGCACGYSDDEDDWYKDCPRPDKDPNRVITVSEMETDFRNFAE